MIEPIFERDVVAFVKGDPVVFTLPSRGSGQDIHIHFCAGCGTKLALTFARWPDRIGLYAGTLDNPAATPITGDAAKQIFVSEARSETVLFAGIPTYLRHAAKNDGTLNDPVVPVAPVRADVFRAQVKAAAT